METSSKGREQRPTRAEAYEVIILGWGNKKKKNDTKEIKLVETEAFYVVAFVKKNYGEKIFNY